MRMNPARRRRLPKAATSRRKTASRAVTQSKVWACRERRRPPIKSIPSSKTERTWRRKRRRKRGRISTKRDEDDDDSAAKDWRAMKPSVCRRCRRFSVVDENDEDDKCEADEEGDETSGFVERLGENQREERRDPRKEKTADCEDRP